MAISDEAASTLLVDTSVAIALVTSDHEHHTATFEALADHRLGLAGHAAFETFSVLTRLPPPARRTPAAVARILASGFPCTKFLSAAAARGSVERFASVGIAGGAIYDALIGAAASEHGLTLVTRDRRAFATYRVLDVRAELLR